MIACFQHERKLLIITPSILMEGNFEDGKRNCDSLLASSLILYIQNLAWSGN